MVLTKLGILMEAIVAFMIAVKFASCNLSSDVNTEDTINCIEEILIFATKESIPLGVTLIWTFGVLGVILIVADSMIERI